MTPAARKIPDPPPATRSAATKRILFVDDEDAVLRGLRNVLRSERAAWSMRFAQGGEEALAMLEEEPADVVVTDMRMPGMDGLALLREVQARHPDAARIVLSGYADLAAVAQAAAVAHQYLMKPCDPEMLRHVVRRACELQDLLRSEALRRTVGAMGSLPSAPRLYHRLTTALSDPDVDVKKIAAIIREDVAMTSRVLQFVNSAYYGLAHRVTSVESAIVYLGMGTVRHLTLTLDVLEAFHPAVAGDLAEFERHALLTGRIARRLVGVDAKGEAAFAAGLLHDAGKLVLMNRLPDALARSRARAALEGISQSKAEALEIGADHAGVGAYLLGLWGLPHEIVEAVAFHHADERLAADGLDLPVAVAVADRLAHGAAGANDPPAGALEALARDRLATWRKLADEEARRVGT